MNPVVQVKGLTKKIGQKQVLKGVDFKLEPGKVVGVLGPNGAGKTTLLKTLVNIYRADQGEIEICGAPVGFETKKYFSYAPDLNHLFPWMRVRDALGYYRDLFADFDPDRARELCSFLKINEAEKVKDLSKGGKEQVLVMLTFSRHTALYILDEPLGGIDLLTRSKIIKTIFAGLNGASTIVITTHLVKDVENLLDEVLFINDGRLILAEPAETIRATRGKSIEECYLEVFANV